MRGKWSVLSFVLKLYIDTMICTLYCRYPDTNVHLNPYVLMYIVGITGPVAIDAEGNRIADFDLLDMKDPDSKEFHVSILTNDGR